MLSPEMVFTASWGVKVFRKYPTHGGSIFRLNVCTDLANYTAAHVGDVMPSNFKKILTVLRVEV
jgi:hypothetical protein